MTGTGNLLQRAIPRLYLAASGTVTNDSVSDVLDSAQEVTKDTANEVNQFVQYFYDHIPNLIAFGMKVLFAIIFFLIGRKVIKWIRKIVSRSMERANADVGVKQFVDSMLKFVMYAVLIFLIATIWCGIFFSSGTDCISRCSHWSCSSGKSFQFCRGNTDPYFKTI